MKRENGFYWVKRWGVWIVAAYQKDLDKWEMPGVESFYFDCDFQEIDERRLQHGE